MIPSERPRPKQQNRRAEGIDESRDELPGDERRLARLTAKENQIGRKRQCHQSEPFESKRERTRMNVTLGKGPHNGQDRPQRHRHHRPRDPHGRQHQQGDEEDESRHRSADLIRLRHEAGSRRRRDAPEDAERLPERHRLPALRGRDQRGNSAKDDRRERNRRADGTPEAIPVRGKERDHAKSDHQRAESSGDHHTPREATLRRLIAPHERLRRLFRDDPLVTPRADLPAQPFVMAHFCSSFSLVFFFLSK